MREMSQVEHRDRGRAAAGQRLRPQNALGRKRHSGDSIMPMLLTPLEFRGDCLRLHTPGEAKRSGLMHCCQGPRAPVQQ